MNFVEKLDYLMSQKGLNKSTLSKMSGVPYTTIDGFYKKGYDKIKLPTLRNIARALQVSMDYLVYDEIENPEYGLASDLELNQPERTHIQKYRRLTDNGRATVDNVIDGLLEAGHPAREQEQKEPEKILLPVAARGGTGEPLEVSPDTARLLEETKEWRREQIKNSDVF